MSETQVKTLAQMTAEVVQNNTAHGWYETCATFPEALALLHSEVSEALDAWRKHGLEEWFVHKSYPPEPGAVPKPEGVPSEFADIFIRLLDDAWLFGQVDLEHGASRLAPLDYLVTGSFPGNMNILHDLISKVSRGPDGGPLGYEELWASILVYLRELCVQYDIDLLAEYEKKMAFNRTRPYRHGDKRI